MPPEFAFFRSCPVSTYSSSASVFSSFFFPLSPFSGIASQNGPVRSPPPPLISIGCCPPEDASPPSLPCLLSQLFFLSFPDPVFFLFFQALVLFCCMGRSCQSLNVFSFSLFWNFWERFFGSLLPLPLAPFVDLPPCVVFDQLLI